MRGPRLALILGVVVLQGCGASRAAAPSATLPPDSAELLRRALERVRPAFPTQEEAIRAGVYAGRTAAASPADEPVGIPPRSPAPVTGAAAPSPDAPPAPPRERSSPDHPDPAAEGARRFGIQVAAFRDAVSADLAAAEARRTFPRLDVSATLADGWFRVILTGWALETEATAALPAVRSRYPSAWVRPLPVP